MIKTTILRSLFHLSLDPHNVATTLEATWIAQLKLRILTRLVLWVVVLAAFWNSRRLVRLISRQMNA